MESDLMEVERRERELLDQWRLLKEQKFRLYKEHEQSLEQLRSELRRKKTEVATLEEKLLEWENKLSKLSSSAEPEICSSVFPLREEAEIKVENVSNDQFDVDEIQNVLVTEEESVDEMYDDDVGSTSNSIDAGEESSHSSPNVLKKVSKKKKPKKSARVRRGCYKSVAVQLVDRSLRTLFKLILETLNVRNDAEMVVDGVRLDVLLPDVLSDFEDRDNERRLMKNSCMAYKVMEAFDECLFLAEKLGCFSKVSAEAKDAYMAIVREKRLTVSRIRGRRSIRRKNKYEIYQKACSLRKLL